ncbi:hypothetical protein B0H14DRAFT_3603993 [Mycena olivaceomarginata]|nr:hypothetical protein B0H14DRAFT_3603993 [Mycena olivaceomarginata]
MLMLPKPSWRKWNVVRSVAWLWAAYSVINNPVLVKKDMQCLHCKVREWDISYESLTSLQIRARLRNEEADKTELWKELQGSKADQDLPLESKEVAEDVVDEEEGPDDSNITPAAVVADVTPMFEAMDGAEEVKEQGTGRPTQAKKPNRHYLRPGWLSHEDEQDLTMRSLSQMLTAMSPNFESLAKIFIEASEANIACIESQIRDLERLRDRDDYMACMKGWLERLAPMPIAINLEISGKARDTGEALMDIITTTAHQWSDIHLKLPSLSMLSHIPTACLKSLEPLTPGMFGYSVQCTSIVSARFETGAWPDVPDLSQPPITTLGQLEDLSVSLRGCVVPFFVCLALPALKKLCLDSQWMASGLPGGRWSLPNPAQVSSIQCLEISSSYLLSSDLLAVLQHVPLLAELQMDSYPNTFHDFITGGHSIVLRDVNFEEDVLDAMIQSQWWTDEQSLLFLPLPKLPDGENVTGELEAKLEQYRSQGLDVLVYHIPLKTQASPQAAALPLANTQIHDDPHKPPWIHVTTGWELQFDDGW